MELTSLIGTLAAAIFYAALISIPLFLILMIIRTARKASKVDQLELEIKNLRDEVKSMRENQKLPPHQ